MLRALPRTAIAAAVLSLALVAAAPLPAAPPGDSYTVTPLASDIPGVAPTLDANLVNGWGLARSATSPWWVADNGTDKTTIYNGAGVLQNIGGNPFQVVAGGPTGAVFSGIAGQFQVGTTTAPTTLGTSNFVFASEDGKIRAWRGGSTAALVTASGGPGAIYKGLAISNGASGPRLYATDFHNARVDVFDGAWHSANVPGAFVDPELDAGYAPFGIQTIGTRVFVTYAKQDADAADEVAGQGRGFVDAYDLTGNFLGRVAEHGQLNAPWGVAAAPASFGRFGGDVLVGNFGDGRIYAYAQEADGSFAPRGTLRDADGKKLEIDGLWALEFGNAGSNGTPDQLFFTAGPEDESHGLFGTITAG
ncbi:MAG: TIGR03118 family protein [Gaiellaceae bacterium]